MDTGYARAWVDGDDPLMVGPVEIDETYVGGKDKNKRGGQRGPTGKAPVMGTADRHTGSVSLEALDRVDGDTAVGFIAGRVCYSGVVFTDETRVYHRLHHFGYRHGRVAHSKGEYRRGLVSTNRIESVWALLKQSYVGTYHWMSQKHLHCYCAEVENRVNKTVSLAYTYDRLIGRQLRYVDLTA